MIQRGLVPIEHEDNRNPREKTMRKTWKINDLVEYVNHLNEVSTCSADTRKGWNEIVEYVLMESDRYKGFVYLTLSEVPKGEKPGVVHGRTPQENVFPDETRRRWILKNK